MFGSLCEPPLRMALVLVSTMPAPQGLEPSHSSMSMAGRAAALPVSLLVGTTSLGQLVSRRRKRDDGPICNLEQN